MYRYDENRQIHLETMHYSDGTRRYEPYRSGLISTDVKKNHKTYLLKYRIRVNQFIKDKSLTAHDQSVCRNLLLNSTVVTHLNKLLTNILVFSGSFVCRICLYLSTIERFWQEFDDNQKRISLTLV